MYLVRFNGGVGFLPADVDGWAGVHALQTAGAAPQHVPAYEVNVNYALREDITVKAGYRDYPAEFDPPYAKRDKSSDPIRAYRGQVGGYGQVDFKVNWPVGQPSDLSVRLGVRAGTAKPDTDVTYGKVDWRGGLRSQRVPHRKRRTAGQAGT